MNQIKLIALDMDGTLLNDQEEITEKNRQAIRGAQERGIYVVLSTGRSIATCREYADALQLSSYLVTVNGSEIWGDSGELVEQHSLPTDSILWMHELAERYLTNFWCVTTDKVWRNEFPDDVSLHQWLKFGFQTSDDQARTSVLRTLANRHQFEISNSNPTNIEVNAKGVNKANGLQSVCDRLNITMDHVLAMGDSLNDIAMINEAGYGIAMGNAQQDVKDAADGITGTNNNDGVAQAIYRWVL
ncbi:Cof-type HAD-IIB family hydrolase [Tuberibacillus sp. Marseille-P3662]|uniref:Cof-type HAD-IIB family hydrolase n=1 Tax=Tuberibacillus sp. Marseille-P3662 TaxID=1965358 RepID=UPI000A1C84E9|nr:Cof-type HAD-IIB family hydrolase [Tuberibacillus sp. Marseille-P3662]